MNGNAQIIEAVTQDLAAIGYVGVGYLYDEKGEIRKGIKVLKSKKTKILLPTLLWIRKPSTLQNMPFPVRFTRAPTANRRQLWLILFALSLALKARLSWRKKDFSKSVKN